MAAKKQGTRDLILAADDLRHEDVHVPEWGCTVRLKAMTGEERDSFESSILRDRSNPSSGVDPRNFHAKFLVRILCDADGKRLFSDDDVELLSGKSASVLDRLYDVGASLAGLLPSDAERLAGN